MARNTIGKLTALAVSRAKRRGMLGDGNGLYLSIARGGSRSWVFRFKRGGKTRHLGLGALHAVSLAQARERAADARRMLLDGRDPIEARKGERAAARLDAAKAITFSEAARAYVEAHRAGWRNEKHAGQWAATLKTYAGPVLGDLAVQAIDVGLIVRVLEPLWTAKPETASRLARAHRECARIGRRCAAIVNRRIPPAGAVTSTTSCRREARSRGSSTTPHSLTARSVPSWRRCANRKALRPQRCVRHPLARRAPRRPSTVVGRNRSRKKGRTDRALALKGGREHRVPLSDAALATLKDMGQGGDYPFPGQRRGQPLSNMAMLSLLRRMGRSDLTVHGFRSSFRDWAAEQTNFPSEVAEMALAHVVGDKVEAAYRRGDLFDKRRRLMDAWAVYCAKPTAAKSGDVVPMFAKSDA